MALTALTVTLAGTVAVQATATYTPAKYVRIESEVGNAAVQYGDSTVSSTVYAGTVLANVATINNAVVLGPFDTMPIDVNELYFVGTGSQKVHLTIIS